MIKNILILEINCRSVIATI